MAKSLYRLTEGDKAIFAKIPESPNYFTDYYIRGDATGTWWRPVEEHSSVPEIQEVIDKWVRGYDILNNKWRSLGKPDIFEHRNREYIVHYELDFEYPAFHDHHGFIFLPWQLQYWNAKQTTKIIIGGYGSAKTSGTLVANLIRMATLRQYTCYVVAEYSRQAQQVFIDAKNLLTGTEYEKRFLLRSSNDTGWVTKPTYKLTVKNSQCIESTMEFLSIEQDPARIKNLQGDAFHIEQAEQFNNLDQVMEYLGSRLRGQVGGRPRLGLMEFVANSEESGNPQLWDLADEALTDPKGYFFLQPETFDNIYITPKQLIDIEKRMPKDPEHKDRALKGARPLGSGEHFPKKSLERCRSKMLDDKMQTGREAQLPGYVLKKKEKAQVVEWAMPPEEDHLYILAADPGYSNPPYRNSPALFVFDITDYPHIPAHLTAFAWPDGNNSPEPWIAKFLEFAATYKCQNRCAFDATAWQSGYERELHGLTDLNPWPVKLNIATKATYLNALKTLMSQGKLQIPDIPLVFSQLSNYKLPDDKLRQDLVMALLIIAGQIDFMFSGFTDDQEKKPTQQEERYGFHSRAGVHAR